MAVSFSHKPTFSYPPEKIKILLLEGVHKLASEILAEHGYRVDYRPHALVGEDLESALEGVHLLGIRSKTQITAPSLRHASQLLAIGCFGIGTNQVDLDATAQAGVPVFNAPFGSTRSVAELTIGEMILLCRGAVARNAELHQGVWHKITGSACEVRGKTIGIVGYGHIGLQVGVIAEALGMHVLFYDVVPKLPFGNARAAASLAELLGNADVVTLHVPETPDTLGMIGAPELDLMKRGAVVLNLSRGRVVDLDALATKVSSGHIWGAGVDVFPVEPAANGSGFDSPLIGLPNVFLTPHIGAATLEAQANIGREVAQSLLRFLEQGSTTGAVNFPHVELPVVAGTHRVLNIHKNVPGVLGSINEVVARMGINIYRQYLSTHGEVGYLIMDVDSSVSRAVKTEIDALPNNIRTRLLF